MDKFNRQDNDVMLCLSSLYNTKQTLHYFALLLSISTARTSLSWIFKLYLLAYNRTPWMMDRPITVLVNTQGNSKHRSWASVLILSGSRNNPTDIRQTENSRSVTERDHSGRGIKPQGKAFIEAENSICSVLGLSLWRDTQRMENHKPGCLDGDPVYVD